MRRVTVYVASSWRNETQPWVVQCLREEGFEVYDFRHPEAEDYGFHWSMVGPAWKTWTVEQYRAAMETDLPTYGFLKDMEGLNRAQVVVLVLPSGRNAHLEAGYAVGAGKRVVVYMPGAVEPELMYKMCDAICSSMEELVVSLRELFPCDH